MYRRQFIVIDKISKYTYILSWSYTPRSMVTYVKYQVHMSMISQTKYKPEGAAKITLRDSQIWLFKMSIVFNIFVSNIFNYLWRKPGNLESSKHCLHILDYTAVGFLAASWNIDKWTLSIISPSYPKKNSPIFMFILMNWFC